MDIFRDICQHNIPFRLCGLMFLFIPVGMLVALVLYQRHTSLSARLPFPRIITKGVAPTDPENGLMLVLTAWYVIYFHSRLTLESLSCQRCHAHIVILVWVVRSIELLTPSNASPSPHRSSGPETHWIIPAFAGIVFGYSMTVIFMCFLA